LKGYFMTFSISQPFSGFEGSVPGRTPRILVAISDAGHRAAASAFFAGRGHIHAFADSVQDVLVRLRSDEFDLLVCAMRDADGFDLMRLVRRSMPGLPVIMIALGSGELERAHLDCATSLQQELFGEGVAARLAGLTVRERQVLNLIVAGRANKIIAYELSISPRTVENHRARLMEKLRVKSVAELVRLALSAADFAPLPAGRMASANDTGGARAATAAP
jgi:FixJ family two-component response regulator